jgi:DNA-binding transcriptional LysR family regulator
MRDPEGLIDKSEDLKHSSIAIMNPTLRQFAAFVQVARLASFARASEALGLSQPALSQSVTQMEQVLGMRLFHRTTRIVHLTPEGALLLPRAEAILASVDEAVELLRHHTQQACARIRLGTLPSVAAVFLPEILRVFREREPATRVAVTDGTSDVLYAGVESGQIDLAIGSPLRGHPDVSFSPILRERFALVLRRDHPLAESASVNWDEALRHDFIAFPPGSGGYSAIHDALERAGLSATPVMTLGQSNTVLTMVEAGVGITALPALGCPSPDHRILTVLPLANPVVDREVGLILPATVGLTVPVLALKQVIIGCMIRQAVPGLIAPVKNAQRPTQV